MSQALDEESGTTTLSQLNVRQLLEIPLRHPLAVVLPTVLAAVAAASYGVMRPKLYVSSTLIIVETQQMPQSFGLETGATRVDERMRTVKQEILARTRLEQILDEIDPYPEDERPRSAIIDGMRNAITVTTRGQDAFAISYIHPQPEMAQKVVDRMGTLFTEGVAETRNRQVEEASAFMRAQVEQAAEALEEKEATVRRFKERHMGSLPNQLNTNLATLQRLQLEHQAVSESLRGARDRQVMVEQNLSAQLRAVGAGADPVTELPALLGQLAELRGRYTDEHPDVQRLLARVGRMETANSARPPVVTVSDVDPAVVAARSQLDQVRLEISSLEGQKADLEQRMTEIQRRVDQVPAREQELLSLTREYDQLQKNYSSLLEKKLSAEMAARLEHRWQGAHFRILDPASMPERPYSRVGSLVLALIGMFMGAGFGVALAAVAEFLDDSIKSLKELEALVPRPVLVSVPHVGSAPSAQRVLRRLFGSSDDRQ